jgi:hypothetical protein
MGKSNARGVPAQASILTEHANAIRQLGKRVAADVIEIGRRLADCRDHHLERGKWLPWLQTEFDWSERTALNFIRVYEQSKSANFADFDLPISSLYLLAAPSTPEKARKEIAKRAKGGKKIKHDDVRKVIKKHKAAKKSAAETPATLTWEKKSASVQEANHGKGKYKISTIFRDRRRYIVEFYLDRDGKPSERTPRGLGGEFKTLEQAKAACEQHAQKIAPAADEGRETSGDADQEPAGGKEQLAPLDETAAAPDAPLTREQTLQVDGYWAVLLADGDIDGARRLYEILCDEERRTVFIRVLGNAIKAASKEDNREAIVDVLADVIGVTDKTASDANGSEADPKVSADRMRETFAAMDDETSGEWQIKAKKYSKGWWWSATIGDRTLSCPTDVLFATQDEAQGAARAAIASETSLTEVAK